jgi:feruloyl esterase
MPATWKAAMTATNALRFWCATGLLAVCAVAPDVTMAKDSCADLTKLALPDATVTAAEPIAAGQYAKLKEAMNGRSGLNIAGRLQMDPNPAFCRVAATLKPTADSDIKIEVWLPLKGWNGKMLAVGNYGGWAGAGALMYNGMLTGLYDGYATVSTDTGHGAGADEQGGKYALNQPAKVIDWEYRATHLMTVDGKSIVRAFYGKTPTRSYMIGCALGGAEGLIEARKYPLDYDGIVAGAPHTELPSFSAGQMYPGWLISEKPERLIPQAKYAMVHSAVVKRCASPIGQQDNLVDEPEKCDFDPAQLLCKGADAPDCLTAPQVDLLQRIYAGPVNPRTHEKIFPGLARGSELDMFGIANGREPTVPVNMFRYAVFHQADWNWKAMDWDKDMKSAIDTMRPLVDVDADLGPFFDHGGKLLIYIGWNDDHNPSDLISYYQSLVVKVGTPRTRQSLRLFTIPGMGHCSGSVGCDTFNKLSVLDAWVTRGRTPERIVAAKVEGGKVVRTRPLCAWPKVAKYKGSGDTSDAANFNCTAS